MQAPAPSGLRRLLPLLLVVALAGIAWLIWPGRPEPKGQTAAGAPQLSSGIVVGAADLRQDAGPERTALAGGAPDVEPLAGALANAQAPLTSDWLALPCTGVARRSGPAVGRKFRFSGHLLAPDGSALPAGTQLRACLNHTALAPSLGISSSYARSTDFKVGDAGGYSFSIEAGSAPGRLNASLEFWYAGPAEDAPWSARSCLPDLHVGGDFELGVLRLLPAPILVTGRVVDSMGQPLAHVPVRVLSATPLDHDGRDPQPRPAHADPLAVFATGEEVVRIPRVRSTDQGQFALHGELASPLFLVGAQHGVTLGAVWARCGRGPGNGICFCIWISRKPFPGWCA
jgi:hypothetical protein